MSNNLREERLKSLEFIRQMGIDPFGGKFPGVTPIKDVLAKFPELETHDPNTGTKITTAGRIMTLRAHGKAAFLDIHDRDAKIQVYIKKDKVGEQLFALYEHLDMGDIIGVTGVLFKTRTGEITIYADSFTLLTKTLLPMPEKWHGLTDVETRYRKRYLDLISNPEVRASFVQRTKMINSIRQFLQARGFLEVETPMMHPIPGGATARPFTTHHNALNMQLYLRIAPELYLKRLLVGGMEKVFEINRNFRNEGISTKHNPEFTMMELYEAYGDYNTMMELTESLVVSLVKEISPDMKLAFGEKQIDFTAPWQRKPYLDLFKEHVGIDWFDKDAIMARAKKEGLELKDRSADALANDLFEKFVEPNLQGPVFIIDYPTAICPLTKAKKDKPQECERFELFIATMEIANAFTELNDPLDRRARFQKQLDEKAEGMARMDEDFVTALEHGMPPAGGLGIGIDRLVMLLTNKQSIRDVILFPLMREREEGA